MENEVLEFLKKIKQEKHFPLLEQNGLDSLNMFEGITDLDLVEIGVPKLSAKFIMSKWKEGIVRRGERSR